MSAHVSPGPDITFPMKTILTSSPGRSWPRFFKPLAAFLAVVQSAAAGQVVQNLSHVGDVQSWTVPDGVEVISLTLTGAQGGRGADDGPGSGAGGGNGGRVTGRLAVTPGEVLTLHLGAAGAAGSFASNGGGGAGGASAGGLYSGGRGGNSGSVGSSGGGGGGGAAAAILRGATVLAVAGGAGGGGGAGGSTEWFFSDNQANRDGLSGYTGGYTTGNAGTNGTDRGTGNDGGGGGGGGGGYTRGGSGGTLRKTGNNNTGGNGGSAGENFTSGLTSASASYVAVTGAANAAISYMEPSVFGANFATASTVPATGTSIDVSNATLSVQLGFAPAPGAVLTVANNTGGSAVVGTFVGLAQGASVTGTYGGDTFRFTLSYTGGTGNDITLTRESSRAPVVSSSTLGWVGSENATVSAAVNPNGFITSAVVEYGYSTVYGRTRAFTLSPANGSASQNVSAALDGLKPGTLHHYRVTVTNVDGTASTANGTFTTRAVGTVTPADRIAGMENQTIVLTGSGFASGATAAFSGDGITVKSVTVNSAQQVTLVIDIARSATPGGRGITITNPDGSQWIAGGTLSNAGFDPGNGANGEVNAVLPLPDGKTLIAGAFTAYDTYPRQRLARLNADGSLDTAFVPVIDGQVRAIARQTDGKLIIGGDFTSVSATARARVARLNADGTLDTTFAPGSGANQIVRAVLVAADGKVLIGGDFTSVAGSTRNRLARLSATGALDGTYNPNVDGPVHALLAHPTGTLVGGAFGRIGTSNVFNIALLNATGVPDMDFTNVTVIGEHDFGVRTSGTVMTLVHDNDGGILVGGDFIEANGLECRHLTRVTATGMAVEWPQVAGPVRSIVSLPNDSVLVAGVFAGGIVRMDYSLEADPSFDTSADAAVNALALQADGKLLAGGAFTSVNGVVRRGIARFTAEGALDVPVRSDAFVVWEPMRLDSVNVTALAQGLSNRSLVITGGGFKPGATLSFSNPGITLTGLTVNSATRMTAVVNVASNAAPGPVSLVVNNADGGTDTLVDGILLSASPSIAAVTPASRASGSLGGQLVIDGSAFQPGATVSFSGAGITLGDVTVASSGRITARIDVNGSAASGPRNLVVTNPDGGTITQTAAFTVNAAPALASLTPSARAVGLQAQAFILTGNHFQTGAGVSFSGSGVSVTSVNVDSSTQLTVVADIDSAAALGARAITITQPDGGSVTLNGALTLNSRPTIASVNAGLLPQGSRKTVTLGGTGLTSASTVTCPDGDIQIGKVNLVSASEITAELVVGQSADTGVHALTVTNPDGGSATLDAAFEVTPGPRILALSPSRRLVGLQDQAISVSGSGFDSGLSLEFSGSGITVDSFTVNSASSVSLVLDFAENAVPGGRSLTLRNPDGGSFVLENAITLGARPTFVSIAPGSRGQGALDQSLVITGTGLQDGAEVQLGAGVTVKQVTRQSDSQLTAVVDVAPTAELGGRSLTLTNPDGGTVSVQPVVTNPGFIAAGQGADAAVNSVREAADGKIVIGGAFSQIGGTLRGRIARLNSDGSLDESFDPGFGFNGDVADVAVQPDGKIVAAGAFTAFNGTPCGPVLRLNPDGSIDSGFTVPSSLNGSQVRRIVLQGDGKLIVAASSSVIRLLTDGTVDGLFQSVGVQATVIALQPDWKILVGGAGFIARYDAYGAQDVSMPTGPVTCTALVLQPDGKIVVGFNGGIGRLNADFSFDGSFSTGPLGEFPVTALAGLNDGGLIAAAGLGASSLVVRLGSNGAWDTSFAAATSGFVQCPGVVNALLRQSDGKVLLGGSFSDGIARISAAGAADVYQATAPFSVTASPSVTNITGADLGQGSSYNNNNLRTLIIDGTNLAQCSLSASGTGVNVQQVIFNSATRLEVAMQVAPDAAVGPRDLILVNQGDGGRTVLAGALTINPAPQVTAISPAVCGQGASNVQIELSGNHFHPGARIIFDGRIGGASWLQPVVVSPELITVSLTLPEDVEGGDVRVLVYNPDGGSAESASFLTVVPGPKVSAISPNHLGAGARDAALVVTGSNFASGASVTFTNPGVQVKSVTVDSPTQLTVLVDVDSEAAPGGGGLTVMNPDRGTDVVPSIGYTAGFIIGRGLESGGSPWGVYANAMVVQPDGRIIVGGKFDQYDGVTRNYLARLHPDGSLDTSFDAGAGITTTLVAAANAQVRALALQPDGKILVGGHFTSFNGVARNHIMRLNPDGSLDTTFNPGSGVAVPNISTVGWWVGVNAIQVLADGRILAAGCFESCDGQARSGIVRLNADGSVDTTFSTSPGANVFYMNFVECMMVLPDGRILLGGTFSKYAGVTVSNMVLLNADGSYNSPFASVQGRVYSMDRQTDGKILLAGYYTKVNGTNRGGIARVNADGTLDTSFGTESGIAVSGGEAGLVKVLPDGKILLSGNFDFCNWSRVGDIARLNPDGTVDSSFVTWFTESFFGQFPVEAVHVLPDGKLLIAGAFRSITTASQEYNPVWQPHVARLFADGTLDAPRPASAFVVNPAPVAASLDVTSVSRGSSGLSIVLTGDGFVPGASAAFSGTGLTVVTCTIQSATRATLVVNVAANAAAGPRSLSLTNPDGGKTSLSSALSVTTGGGLNPSESWRQQYFGTTENSGNAADMAAPDGDGVANLMKYALCLTPGQNGTAGLPRARIATNSGSRYLSLSFRRDPSRTDVTIIVEVQSGIGGAWTEIARSVNGAAFTGAGGVTETEASDGTKDVEIRDTQTVGSASRRFMRVRAESSASGQG